MKRMKKLMAYVLAFVMVLSMCTFVTGADEQGKQGEQSDEEVSKDVSSGGVEVEEASGVSLKVKVKEGKVTITLKAKEDLQLFEYGITYKPEQMQMESKSWDAGFAVEYTKITNTLTIEDIASRKYVVVAGSTEGSFPYEGTLAHITFAPKEGIETIDSVKIYINPRKTLQTSGAPTLEETSAIPLAETGEIDVTKDTPSDPGEENPGDDNLIDKPVNPPVSVSAQSADGMLIVKVSGNDDFKDFSLGVTYNKNQLVPKDFQWNRSFSGAYELKLLGMGGTLRAGAITEKQYIALGGTNTSSFKFDGELATITFKIKEEVTSIDSIKIIKNPDDAIAETGAESLEATGKEVSAQTGVIYLGGNPPVENPDKPGETTQTPVKPNEPKPGVPTGEPVNPDEPKPGVPTGEPVNPDEPKPGVPTGEPVNPDDTSGEPIKPGEDVIIGDVDGNGDIELTDAQKALRIALLLESLTEENKITADVNEDGAVQLDDAQQILRRALLLISEFEKAK